MRLPVTPDDGLQSSAVIHSQGVGLPEEPHPIGVIREGQPIESAEGIERAGRGVRHLALEQGRESYGDEDRQNNGKNQGHGPGSRDQRHQQKA